MAAVNNHESRNATFLLSGPLVSCLLPPREEPAAADAPLPASFASKTSRTRTLRPVWGWLNLSSDLDLRPSSSAGETPVPAEVVARLVEGPRMINAMGRTEITVPCANDERARCPCRPGAPPARIGLSNLEQTTHVYLLVTTALCPGALARCGGPISTWPGARSWRAANLERRGPKKRNTAGSAFRGRFRFRGADGRRMSPTGDLARLASGRRAGGFLGRADTQVEVAAFPHPSRARYRKLCWPGK